MTDNQVQYIIDMNNRFSEKLERISRDVAAFNSRMDATGARLQKRFDDYGNRIGALPGKIERLQERLTGLQGRLTKAFDDKHIVGYNRMIQSTQRELEKLGKIGLETGNKLPKGAGGLGFLSKLGMGGLLPSLGIAMGVGAVAGGVKEIFDTTAKYEQLNTGFRVLLGSKAKGEAMVGELMKYAAKSPLRNEDVMPAAQTLLGFGVKAEKILPSIKMLGDVSMGNKEKFQGMALAFAQTQAAGKLMGQDLLQMINQGFNPLQEISEMTGRSIGQLKKDMEGGKISSEMVTKAFEHATSAGGRFFGMADKQSQTLGGRLSTLSDNTDMLKKAIGERLTPAFSGALSVASKLVGKLREWFEVPIEEKIGSEISQIHLLQSKLYDANISESERLRLLNELKTINPDIVTGIDAENFSYNQLAANIGKVVGQLKAKIFWDRADKKYGKELADYEDYQGSVTDAEISMGEVANKYGFTGSNFQTNIQKTIEYLASKKAGSVTFQGSRQIDTRNEEAKDYESLSNQRQYYNQNRIKAASQEKTMKKIKAENDALAKSLGYADGGTGTEGQSVDPAPGKKPQGSSLTPGGSKNPSGFDPASGIDTVTSGGSKAVNITVTFGKLVEKFEVHVNGLKEGMAEIENQGTEALLRVLNGANKLATKQ